MTLPKLTPAHVTTAILVACLAYLWIHASPAGRDLFAGLGAAGCLVVLWAIAIRRAL